MGQLYAYRDKTRRIADTAVRFDSAEITGDVVVGDGSSVGAGVTTAPCLGVRPRRPAHTSPQRAVGTPGMIQREPV